MQTIRNQISSWFAESFQNAPTTAPKLAGPTAAFNIEPTKKSITTFFSWWTSLPEEFPKSADILTVLKKWEPYTSTKAPYMLPTFASLDAAAYQSMRSDFTKLYALSLMDTYIALRKRHTTKPPTPLPKLTTESKAPATDRQLVAKGDASLQSVFQTSYYPSLYVGIRAQLLNVFAILGAVVSRVSKEEQEVSARLLPTWREDQAAIQKMPPQSPNVFKDILRVSEQYVDYIRRARQYLPGGEKYGVVETAFRATLQKRVDLFLEYTVENITRDGETPVARAGLSIPPEISKLPTSLPLTTLPLLTLLGIEASYFGKAGVEGKAKALIAKATLELRRDAVESLLRAFFQTRTDAGRYCKEFSKEVQDANTLLPTYWQTTRQKAFNALPLGGEADWTSTEIKSLVALEGRFLRALQALVRNIAECFGKVVAEKAGLQRTWNPHTSAIARFESPLVVPKQVDLTSLLDLRDSYMQVWGFIEIAARQQITAQYTAFVELRILGELVGIEVPSSPTEPTRDVPLYDLQSIYNECDQKGQQVLAKLQEWIASRLQEYSNLYERYQVFRARKEVQDLYTPVALEDVFGRNTTEQDVQTLKAYTFYTPRLSQELEGWMGSYTKEPVGKFPQLRAFLRGELTEFVRVFKSQWDSFGVKPYPAYAGDVKALATDMTGGALEGMMDRYTQYVSKTTAMEGLQEFVALQRDVRVQYELFRALYEPNRTWLPTLPPAVQSAADSYEADAGTLDSVRSLQGIGPLLAKYTAAVRGIWLHLEENLPKLVFTPYAMLLAEYEIFRSCVGSARDLPVESIEKDRLLFKSFLEPSTALVSWLNRFRTTVLERTFPQLQAFVVEELQAYARSEPNPPTLYLSTPYELRDSLHDISVSLCGRDLAATKSRAFQQISAFIQAHNTTEGQFSPVIEELFQTVQSTLSRIQETDDAAYILTQMATYKRGVLELEGFRAVRSLLDSLQRTEYLAAYEVMQKTGRTDHNKPETAADFVATCKKFLATVWNEYRSSSSRTRDYILPLSADTYASDQNTVESDVKSWIALGKQYATHVAFLDLANQQEAVLVQMDQLKDGLYGPFANFIEMPFPIVKLAFATDGNRWTAKQKPGSLEEVAEYQKTLEELAKVYAEAIQTCLSLIQTALQTHLKSFGDLFTAYEEFDVAYSQYFDVEPIPASLQNKSAEDLAALQAMPNEQILNAIRIKYFFFPETSDVPTLVRFIKLQLQLYLQYYVSSYEELETALQPPKLPVPTLMTRVRPAAYHGVGDLSDLLEVVGQLKQGTGEVQVAKAIQTKKETTRTLLDSLDELMDLFREQLEYKNFAKIDINIPQMRIDLQYTTRKEEIDEKYEKIGIALSTLASEALRQFNTTYNKNVELRSYFYRNAVDVLNAFTLYFPQDVERVSTNTAEQNLALAKRYVGYTKIVLDAQPAAAVIQDTTQAYRSATLRILNRVEGVQEQLKKYKDLSGGTWDLSGARGVIAAATFVHEMEPTRKAYERVLQEQESKVFRYCQQSIQAWKQLYDSIAPFQTYLAPSQQAIAGRTESLEGKSVEVLLNLANKYIRYRIELQKYIAPTSPFFSKVRLDVQERIDTHIDHLQQVRDLSGVLPPTTLDVLQDRKSVQTASFPVLQGLSRQYTAAEAALLAAVSDFATRVIQDQFLMNNKTLDVPEYAVPRERAVALVPLLQARTLPLSSVLVEVQKYGSLLARLEPALVRQQIKQQIEQLDAEADEIELVDPHVLDSLPDWDAERTRIATRIASLHQIVELEKMQAILVSYRESMQSQFTAAVEKEMREFEALYKEVLRDGTISEYGGEFLKAYTALDTTRKEIRAGATLQRRATIRKQYADVVKNAKMLRAQVLSKREQEAKAAWKENQTKRMETSAAMERFLKAYASYTSSAYPPKFRKAIGQTTADLDRIQKSTSRAELQELLIKYLTLMRDFQKFLEEDQAKRSEEVGLLIQRFKSQYLPHIPTLHTFPSYLRLDVRMIDRDLGTLQGAPDIAVVASLEQKYEAYMAALTKYLGEMGVRVGHRLNEKKQAVRALIQELNDAGVKQARVFQFFPVEVQRKFRAIPADLEYLKNPTLTAAELEEMEREYKGLLETLRAALVDVDAEEANAALLPSLRQVQDLFRERYATIDASRIPPKDMPFFQELLRGISNPVSSEQAEQALAAYRQGLQRLQALPTTQERRIPNTPFDQLQEAIGFFQKEYGIRDVSSLIQNDRLLLNSLQNDAASYIRLYKTPPPNMRNYAEIVQQVAKQYWDGVRILRTYALR